MAERYLFFNSAPGDVRKYQANDFATYFDTFISSGIITTSSLGDLLRVYCDGNDLRTYVSPGSALLSGHFYQNTSNLYLEHALPEATMDRIDRIVLRLDKRNQSRFIKLFVKQGTAATNPFAPVLQRDEFIYEVSLARILVRANTSTLRTEDLVDERLDELLCGIAQLNMKLPTSQFQEQWDAFMAEVQDDGFATPSYVDNAIVSHKVDETVHGIGDKTSLKTSNKNSIVEAINEIQTDISDVKVNYVMNPAVVTATNSGNDYSVNLSPALPSLVNGLGLVVTFTNASTGAARIRINSMNFMPIRKPDGTPVDNIKANGVYTLRYSTVNTAFILQGEGGIDKNLVIPEEMLMKSAGPFTTLGDKGVGDIEAVDISFDSGFIWITSMTVIYKLDTQLNILASVGVPNISHVKVLNGSVYVTYGESGPIYKARKYDINLNMLWTADFTSMGMNFAVNGIDVIGNLVLLAMNSSSFGITCLDANTGTRNWQYTGGVMRAVATDGYSIFAEFMSNGLINKLSMSGVFQSQWLNVGFSYGLKMEMSMRNLSGMWGSVIEYYGANSTNSKIYSIPNVSLGSGRKCMFETTAGAYTYYFDMGDAKRLKKRDLAANYDLYAHSLPYTSPSSLAIRGIVLDAQYNVYVLSFNSSMPSGSKLMVTKWKNNIGVKIK